MPITKEEQNRMKYLKINDNKAFFCLMPESDSPAWNEIDSIKKDDLMTLLNKAIGSDFEMDEYVEELLANKAHQIIYKRLFEKFTELIAKKDMFNDELENTYKSALEKYSVKVNESTN